jgi:hypothetical protein
MANHNPYAPSRASLESPVTAGSGGEVWCDDKWVVMSVDAALPHRCIRCNEPAAMPLKRQTVYWHHPAIYLLLLFWVVIYVIVAAIVRKSAKLEIGLCEEHRIERRNWLIAGTVGLFGSVPAGLVLGEVVAVGAGIIVGFLGTLAAIILLLVKGRMLHAKKIDEDIVRLGGAGEEFLASLPSYRG